MTRSLGTMPVWRDVLQLFARWQMLELDARREWLGEMREQRPEMYCRLQHMIQADSDADAQGFTTTDDTAAELPDTDPDSQRCGMPLGAWILQRPIARGGMGQVWLATRADGLYSGRAAVKLLNTLNAGPEADLRFAREAQFLGRLAHPHIAQLFDAGLTPDGTRYLIMEYVEGAPLDHACNQRQSSIEERLGLFLQVCAAVGYAHSQQIIHRDLKPANILVTSAGQVKLLDFGVAKLMDEDVAVAGLTRADCAWFTLEYAAAEQLVHAPATTATDVYALGVLLFNLLCGGNPHPKRTSLNEAILHYAEPAISLRAGLLGNDAPMIAAQRRSNLAKLDRLLRGELNTIVAKALAVNPAERYDTAHALADDVWRYLRHEPLHARAHHWGYRVRKFVQRNRLQTSAACIVAASLLFAAIFAAWQWQATAQEAQRTRAAIDMLTGTFSKLTPDQSPTPQVAVKDLFREGWRQVLAETAADARLRATIARSLGAMLVDVGELDAGVEALNTSRQYLLTQGEMNSEEYLQVLSKLAYAHYLLGNTTEAKARYAEVIERAVAVPSRPEATINARMWLGEIARRQGQLQLAKAEADRAVAAAKQLFGERSGIYRTTREMLSRVTTDLGDWSASDTPVANDAPSRAPPDSEEELLRRSFDATRAIERGQYVRAAAEFQVLAPATRVRYGTADANTILAYGWLGTALFQSGRLPESETALNQALAWARESPSRDLRANMEVIMARHFLRSNRWEQAEPFIRTALAYLERDSDLHPFAERAHGLRGEMLLRSGHVPEALAELRRAHHNLLKLNGGPSRDTAFLVAMQAIAVDTGTGAAQSIGLYQQSQQLARKFLPPAHPDIAKMQLLLDYARWRAAPSAITRASLQRSARAFAAASAQRSDATALRTLMQRLPESTALPMVRANLLAVVDH